MMTTFRKSGSGFNSPLWISSARPPRRVPELLLGQAVILAGTRLLSVETLKYTLFETTTTLAVLS
jgi:hypothetical protein